MASQIRSASYISHAIIKSRLGRKKSSISARACMENNTNANLAMERRNRRKSELEKV